jgi:hypothetical protein
VVGIGSNYCDSFMLGFGTGTVKGEIKKYVKEGNLRTIACIMCIIANLEQALRRVLGRCCESKSERQKNCGSLHDCEL